MEATDCGRNISLGSLSPTHTERTVAPEIVLNIVSCGCRVACLRRANYRKARLYCTTMCCFCIGQNVETDNLDD